MSFCTNQGSVWEAEMGYAYTDIVDVHACGLFDEFEEGVVGNKIDGDESAEKSVSSSFNALLQLSQRACATFP